VSLILCDSGARVIERGLKISISYLINIRLKKKEKGKRENYYSRDLVDTRQVRCSHVTP